MVPLNSEQYRALVEHAPTMVWRSGASGQRDYVNATWLAFTGRSQEQEAGDGWLEGVHPDDRDACLAIQLDRFERRLPFEIEYRLRRFDGVHRYILDRAAPFPDAAGGFGGFIGSCLDVEERHDGEVSSGAADFFEMSLDNLCVAGFDGYFKRLNPSWTRTLGWTREEMMSRPSLELVHPDDRDELQARRARLRRGQAMGPLINRYLCKDGSYRWFEWRSVAHPERGLVYAAARDITERKLAEERLAEARVLQEKMQRQLIFADRMGSVGTLAAGVAHEINNPLAAVSGNLSMIGEELRALGAASPSDVLTELCEMASEAEAGAERIRKIVLGLKTFSRAEQERRAVLDVRTLLDLSIHMMFNEVRHRARLVKDYGVVPFIEADEARLGQVFINLLINAAQALPEGTGVAHEIRVTTSTDAAGRAVIEIRDTGRGIPAAVIHRIFDPFFTTKPVGIGTGLGLFVCHSIVSGLGGEITVASEVNRGTCFRVVLPAAPPATCEAAVSSLPLATGARSAAVLVIDDDVFIGAVLRRVLRHHDVTVATSAAQALALLDAGNRYDVLFCDLMMPEMSGMELHEELTRRFPSVAESVVFLSGGAFTPAATAFLERVTNERIEKPFDAGAVRELVKRRTGG